MFKMIVFGVKLHIKTEPANQERNCIKNIVDLLPNNYSKYMKLHFNSSCVHNNETTPNILNRV